jgi:hypothetical protein
MSFAKRWKTSWELKSLTQSELFDVIVKIITKQLDGLEKGINDNARNRGIVIHAADYVSYFFIKAHNRLGRSQGCPALPIEFTEKIINKIKDKSCLYIYYPNS